MGVSDSPAIQARLSPCPMRELAYLNEIEVIDDRSLVGNVLILDFYDEL
jgi:hypothetical protein